MLIDRITKAGSYGMNVIPGSLTEIPKAKPFAEFGVSGLNRTKGVGYVYEEWLAQLSTSKAKQIYREMRDNDPVIGSMFFAIEMILRRVEWRVVPADTKKGQEMAEFVEECMEDMSSTWEDFIAECVSMFPFGFALFETVHKRRNGSKGATSSRFNDGRIGWRKFAPRAQESILYWIWDDEGGLQAAVQLAAPDYHTVPIPIEKLLLFRTTSLKNSPEGRSVLRNSFRCFDQETEILTDSGWKFGIDLQPSDKVAVLVDGLRLEFDLPSEIHQYEYKGDMIHFQSRAIDQLVTPNHEVWVRREHKQDYERIRADEAALYQRHKRNAEWQGEETATHVIEAYDVVATEQNGRINVREHRAAIEIAMDDWLAFLGIYIAEGCAADGKTVGGRIVSIAQNDGVKAEQIREILSKLPFHVYEHRESGVAKIAFEICDRQLWRHLRPLGKALVKHVPGYVRSLSSRQIQIFLDAFHLGDGKISGGGDSSEYDGTKTYCTSSVQLADDLAELVLRVGGCPTVRIEEHEDAKNHGRFSNNPMYMVAHGKQNESRPRSIDRVYYDGLVWCVTTKTGVVYVRRNGKCQWSGNSWWFKRRIEEVEGIGIERDLCGIPVLKASKEAIDAMGGQLAAERLVQNLRNDDQAGVVLPLAYDDNGNPEVVLELLKAAGAKQTDPDATIKRYNSDILNTMLAGFIQFGQTPTGSRSLHLSATQIFSLAISAFMDSVAAVMNRIAIARLFALNRFDPLDAPELVPGEVGAIDLEELSGYIGTLANAGLTFFDKPTANYLRKAARLPEEPEEESDMRPPPTGWRDPTDPGSEPAEAAEARLRASAGRR